MSSIFSGLPAARSRGPLKTPEPLAQSDNQPPRPPRQRFRLKRLVSSNHRDITPTEQFLASVDAADVPIPSIEEPYVVDECMGGLSPYSGLDSMDISHQGMRSSTFSPPKTPAPVATLGLESEQFPSWSLGSRLNSIGSSPGYESSRPSTARSTLTSASLFSQFSFMSDDFSECSSPVKERANDFDDVLPPTDRDKTIRPSTFSQGKTKRAQWTQAMIQHLWSTYQKYKDDPTVTPIRMSKSGIPPYGVLVRVAREARRSWKGPNSVLDDNLLSGSATPTAGSHVTYLAWPHTDGATRDYLRKLCKAGVGSRSPNGRAFAASPTPYGKTASRSWIRRAAPARSPSVFSASDMAMSLTVATSESMQPQGPLAQLSRSQLELPSLPDQMVATRSETVAQPFRSLGPAALRPVTPQPRSTRLGSPFVAKSYGPSSSNLFADIFANETDQRKSKTYGHRRGPSSPARMGRSRSNTQKRRSRPSVLQESRKSRRPSLALDFMGHVGASPIGPPSDFSSIASSNGGDLMVPRSNIQELFSSSHPAMPPAEDARGASYGLGQSLELGPPLISPMPTSHSVPNRISEPSALAFGAIRQPFASLSQTTDSGNGNTKASLASRLAYIDDRLSFFRRRGKDRDRSRSPQ